MGDIEPLYQCERCKEDYPEGSCYPLSQLGHAGTKDGPILCDGCMDDYRIENDGGGDPSSWYAVKDPRADRIADLERQLQEAREEAIEFRDAFNDADQLRSNHLCQLAEAQTKIAHLANLIEEHNREMETICMGRPECLTHYRDRGLRCPDCPLDYMIDLTTE